MANAERNRTARILKGLIAATVSFEMTKEVLLAMITAAISSSDWCTVSSLCSVSVFALIGAFLPVTIKKLFAL